MHAYTYIHTYIHTYIYMQRDGERWLTTALKRVDLPTLGRPTMPALRLMLTLEDEEEKRWVNPKQPMKWDFSVRRRDCFLEKDDFNGWTNVGIRWPHAILIVANAQTRSERERRILFSLSSSKIEGKEGHALGIEILLKSAECCKSVLVTCVFWVLLK
jgi:hypothetical protein